MAVVTSPAELVVMGIDPGFRVTGYGLVGELSGQARLLTCGTIRVGNIADLGQRLGRIYVEISELVKEYRPAEAAIENVFVSRNVNSALKLGQARGAAIAALSAGGVLSVHSYEPTKVKKSIVGVGRASKDQVSFMVARILSCKKPHWAEDAGDALAIALCHLNQRRFELLARS